MSGESGSSACRPNSSTREHLLGSSSPRTGGATSSRASSCRPPAAWSWIIGLATLDHLAEQLGPLDAQLISFAKRQRGCKALLKLYGVGHLSAVTILAELGDCRRFSNSDDAVRFSGLDISVYESNDKRSPGNLSRQGPAALRWMLYEAAQSGPARPPPITATTFRPGPHQPQEGLFVCGS